MTRVYVALDLEMTGLHSERDAILEIGAVKFRDDQVLGTWSSLVNPNRPLSHKIERLTGITNEKAAHAPSLHIVLPALERFVGEHPIVGHSIHSDLAFLQHAGYAAPPPALDTFELACILMPYASRFSLARLAEELHIPFSAHHRALQDAQLAHRLFCALLDRAARLDPKVVQEIARVADKSDWSLKYAFQDLVRDRMRKAFAPGTIGAQLAAKGAVADETLGLVFSRDPKERPLKPKLTPQPLDVDALVGLLSPDGTFAAKFPGYEYRPQQVDVLRAVGEAFNNSATLLVEAGTGTGKSLAYLLPAIQWAVQNGQRVVVSTNTINLQDQLFLKDVPALRQVLGIDFKAALLKGRANYLCRRRLDAMRRSDKHSLDEVRVLGKVLAWLPSTTTGDSAELTLSGMENAVWARLASDVEHCSPESCSFRQEGKCFFFRAREKAESAHIIIVNHALLLSDMVSDNAVLPEYQYLIVDEAHHLEARATEALSFDVSKASLESLFRGLANERGGLIGELTGSLRHSNVPPATKGNLQALFTDVAEDIDRALRGTYDFFNALDRFLDQQEQLPGESDTYDRQVRLTAARRAQPGWSAIEIAWEEFGGRFLRAREGIEKIYGAWTDLADSLRDGSQSLQDGSQHDVPRQPDLESELAFAMRRISETRAQMEALVTNPVTQGIYWATINKNSADVSLHAAPLHVGEHLQKRLFAGKEATVLTSATLCVDRSFAHIKSRLGIGDWADELAVGSPFDYESAATLLVPEDIPEPGQPGYQKQVEKILVELLRATQGRALVLFTSHSQLQATYRAITRPLEEDEIIVIAQNLDGSRRQVLETFKTQERTVLLGVKSFWEGVDVAGEALSCVVIARLPFSVPSDPIFAARSETFDDSFAQYAVPEAVLRFRQGFGRLIRTRSDRGIAVVLDRRVLTKNYGRLFLEALPIKSLRVGWEKLPAKAAEWIDGSTPLTV